MSLLLGIDPGTACGWALLDSKGGRVASGTWDLKPRRHEGGGMRYLRLRRYLAEVLEHPIHAVAYEEVRRHAGTSAAHVYGGIIAHVAEVMEDHEVPYRAIPVGTIKKAATGKGNASKGAMVAAALERWDMERAGEDEADALWIAHVLGVELGWW